MRPVILALAALAILSAPAAAAEPPVGEYMCHDSGNTPLGLFRVTGPGIYEWQSVATVDFKTFKDDPSNGPGTYTVDAGGTMHFTGPFADQWQVTATWEQGWVWFANDFGGVMRCGTVLGG